MSRVRADELVNKTASGRPDLPYGFTAAGNVDVNASGIITATAFSGNITGDVTGNINATGLSTVTRISSTDIVSTAATVTTLSATTLEASGNVTIGGTLTYEDVTNIDSVGLITARTGVRVTAGGVVVTAGISTLKRTTITDLVVSGVVTATSGLKVGLGGTIFAPDTGVLTFGTGNNERARITSTGGITLNNAELVERVKITSTAWSASATAGDLNLDNGVIHMSSGVLAGTGNTLNITSSVGINTSMAIGDALSVTGITSVNATTAFVNTLKIDHATVQVAWVGGSTPTAGGNSGYDTYAFNIFKTADAQYSVIGNQVKTS